MLLDIVSGALLVAGTALTVTAVVGLHRLPDVYARMHAATKPATLGVSLCLLGAAIGVGHLSVATKLVLAVAFQLTTAPVAGHILGRAAHDAGAPRSRHTVLDQREGPRGG